MAEDPVERLCQTVARNPPPSHLRQPEHGGTAEPGRVEILVSNGVSPVIQLLQHRPPRHVTRMKPQDGRPQIHPEPAEIRTQASGLGVPSVELPAARELEPHQRLNSLRYCGCHQMIDTFGVEVTAKPLEMRRQ
jgi:hypothetical protein